MTHARTIAATLALLLGTASSAADKGYVTEVDFTHETDWVADVPGRKPLRTVDSSLARTEIFGMYSRPYDFTGGVRLSIFPNGEYTIASWCDVCPEKTLAIGAWTYDGTSIRLSPGTLGGGGRRLGRLRERIGAIETLRVFVTVESGGIADWVLVSEERVRKPTAAPVPALVRRLPYYDWPTRLSEQRKRLEAEGEE